MKMLQVTKDTHLKVKTQALLNNMSIKDYIAMLVNKASK